jgi:hypothetical protein
MKKLNALTVAILGTTLIHAQNSYVHQVIFLNEGRFDYFNDTLVVPPSMASYDPATGIYQQFATLPEARFGTDVVVDDAIYVAADKWLIKYDKYSLQELDRAYVPGIRKIAIWNNYVIATRGEFLHTFSNYVQLFQKSTLTLFNVLDTITGPKYAAEGVAVVKDSAYVAVGNGFEFGNEKGIIGIIDLDAWSYAGEVDMGSAARNPDNVMVAGQYIYTLNNKDYSSSSVSRFDPANRSFTVLDNIAANSGCGTSALANDHIYYMEYAVNHLARFNTNSLQIVDTLGNTAAYYGLADDAINHQLYATTTDYVSSGKAFILDYDGTVKDSFDVGVSAGSIALDLRQSVGTPEVAEPRFTVVPNPFADAVTITSTVTLKRITIVNAVGEILWVSSTDSPAASLDLSWLSPGVYLVEATLGTGSKSVQVIVRR